MMRAGSIALVLVLVGCRPAAPLVAETPPEPEQPVAPAKSVEPVEIIETDTPELVAVERPLRNLVAPPGVGASVTACEQSCGQVHDCALLEPTYTPAAAASIELSCVRACLNTPERATLFGCGRPSAIEPGPCGSFLACVEAAWPEAGGSGAVAELPGPDEGRGDPCMRGCDVFARCWNPATTPEMVEQCAEQCRQALDDEEERHFGTCADLPECADVLSCVENTPKAT